MGGTGKGTFCTRTSGLATHVQKNQTNKTNPVPKRQKAWGSSDGNHDGKAPGIQLTQAFSALAARDPCKLSPCSPLARCSVNPKGQAQCHCPENYHGDGKVCLPLDPCITNFGGCPSNSTLCLYKDPGKVS